MQSLYCYIDLNNWWHTLSFAHTNFWFFRIRQIQESGLSIKFSQKAFHSKKSKFQTTEKESLLPKSNEYLVLTLEGLRSIFLLWSFCLCISMLAIVTEVFYVLLKMQRLREGQLRSSYGPFLFDSTFHTRKSIVSPNQSIHSSQLRRIQPDKTHNQSRSSSVWTKINWNFI